MDPAEEAKGSADLMVAPVSPLTMVAGQELFDDKVRARLAISADEFVRRYHAGRYDDILDDPEYADLMDLALLGGLGEEN
jgi:hypothetical protein